MSVTWLAACWGLAGAAPYSATQLASAFWRNADVEPHEKKLAVAMFAVALFSGPASAAALTPWLCTLAPSVGVGLMAFGVGALSNGIWPILTDKKLLGPLAGQIMAGLGGWLLNLSKKVAKPDD